MINVSYDQFNNGDMRSDSYVAIRPFPEARTIFFKNSKYYVEYKSDILAVFVGLEDAIKYSESFIKHSFPNEEKIMKEIENGEYLFQINNDEVYIRKVKKEYINNKIQIYRNR